MAKSICRTNGDIRIATVWAALRTTLGCSRMILQGAAQTQTILPKLLFGCRFVLIFAIECHPIDWKSQISCRTVWKHSLVEVGFGDLEEGAITLSFDSEDERLSCENSQLTYHLTRLGHKQTHCFLLIDHLLIDVKTAREDKMQTHILKKRRVKRNRIEKKKLNIYGVIMWN